MFRGHVKAHSITTGISCNTGDRSVSKRQDLFWEFKIPPHGEKHIRISASAIFIYKRISRRTSSFIFI